MSEDYTQAHILLPFVETYIQAESPWQSVSVELAIDGTMRIHLAGREGSTEVLWGESSVDDAAIELPQGALTCSSGDSNAGAHVARRLRRLLRGNPPHLLQWRNRNPQRIRWGARLFECLCPNLLVPGKTRYFDYHLVSVKEVAQSLRLAFESRSARVVVELTMSTAPKSDALAVWGPVAMSLAVDDRSREEAVEPRNRVEDFTGYLLSRNLPPDLRLLSRGSASMRKSIEDAAAAHALSSSVESRIEVDPTEGRWSVVADLTTGCNLDCLMCWDVPRTRKVAGDNVVQGLADRMVSHAAHVSLGCLHEPLLHPDLPNVYRTLATAKESAKRDDDAGEDGAYLHLLTSGTLLREGMGRDLTDSGLQVILFSIDSTNPEVYARIRGGAAWKSTKRRLQRFLDESTGLEVVVQAVLTRSTLPHARKTVEDLASMGIRSFHFTQPTQVPQRARGEVIRSGDPEFAELKRFIAWTAIATELQIDAPTVSTEPSSTAVPLFGQGTVWDEDRLASVVNTLCVAPWYNLRIEHNGDVFPCNLMTDPAHSWGNVVAHGFDEIVNHDNALRVRACFVEGRAPHEECLKCPYGPDRL